MNARLKHIVKLLLFGGMVAALSIPAVQHYTQHYEVHELHGTVEPVGYDDFSWDNWYNQKYQEHTEKYINNNFGFRNYFVRLNNQKHYALYNEARANGVIIGKESYLYEENYIKAHYGIDFIGEKEIREKSRKLKRIQEELEKQGKDIYVLFVPGKGSYYPEFIPDCYKSKRKSKTNFKSYQKSFDKLGIHYLDFKSWFEEMKPTAKHPLFPKCGIHWSKYGEFLAADSLIKKIGDIRNAEMPKLVLDKLWIQDENNENDYDIGLGMNLLFKIPTFPMAYPQFHYEWDTTKTQQKVLFVADSYYWGMYNYGFSRDLFGDGKFWYYNEAIYPDSFEAPTHVKDVNIREEVEKHDMVILLSTDANLYKFAYGFIDQLYEKYVD